LSISSVEYSHTEAQCVFQGVDEATAPPVEADGQLGPPQTIVNVFCDSTENYRKRDVALQKRDAIYMVLSGPSIGDLNDGYALEVPLDNSQVYTDNGKFLVTEIALMRH